MTMTGYWSTDFPGHEVGIAYRAPNPKTAPRHALRRRGEHWVTVCAGSPATQEGRDVLRHSCPRCRRALPIGEPKDG